MYSAALQGDPSVELFEDLLFDVVFAVVLIVVIGTGTRFRSRVRS